MKITQVVLATGLVSHAAATWNMYGNPFSSPQYNNNECSEKQKGGFNWADLKDGDTNFNYGDFDFTGGWKCSNSFGKRDHLTKRTFGSKCIKNKVNKKKPATFGCNKRKSGFSITHIDVSVEYDVDLELHYHMEDGSKCKQVAPCKSSGSTIQNTQCGGAKSVDVYLPKHDKSEKDCEIGFHNIGFDCNPGKGYNPPAPPAPPSPPSPPAQPTPPSPPSPPEAPPSCSGEKCKPEPTPPSPPSPPPSCSGDKCKPQPPTTSGAVPPPPPPPCNGKDCEQPTAPATSVPTPPTTETPETPCGGYGQESCEGTTGVPSVPLETPTLATGPPYMNSSAPATTAPPHETSPVAQPPASQPPVSEGASIPPCDGGYGGSCEGTTAASITMVSSATTHVASSGVILTTGGSEPTSPSYPPVSPPDVLPKCMNTWLEVSGSCKNNADASCYCKNKDFTKQVIECVSAWCGTDDETRDALQYLIGICAEHVPENPGLVTDCPTYIPLNPTPASPPAGGASTPAGETGTTAAPGTTPAPEVPGETPPASTPCTTITYGSTTLTIPQVHFTTQTNEAGAPAPTEPVGLVPGNAPPSTPASTTAAPYPISGTTLATFKPTGTGAYSPTSPAEFTGAAAPFKLEAQHAILGAMLAFFAL